MQSKNNKGKDSRNYAWKRGAYTVQESEYIKNNYPAKTIETLSKELNRTPKSIHKFVNKYVDPNTNPPVSMLLAPEIEDRYNIRRKPYWINLKNSFTEKELKLFVYDWKKIINQFQNEVLPTEELQILDLIKTGIEQLRAEQERKKCLERSRYYEELLEKLRRKKSDDPEENARNEREIARVEKMYLMVQTSYKEYGYRITECLKNKSQLMDELKATRAERLKKIENSNVNFTSWLQVIYTDREKAHAMSIELEKMRLASQQALKDFSEYHKYIDGHIDQPILTPELIKEDNV